MRTLFVYPEFPKTFWSYEKILELINRKVLLPPLGLVTVAALLPQQWEMKLVDRNVREVTEAEWDWAQLVVISGMIVQKADMAVQIAKAKERGIPVAVGAFDAHLGGVGAGIRPGTLVKIIGTSTCDMMVARADGPLADIPGLCGIVRGSILPGFWGLEAGQSAVGDIFNWFVNHIQPGGRKAGGHEALTAAAAKLKPGASGLLALDWNNGNRTVLVDQRLTGLLLGQTLYTTAAEIYRALIEATAFGALTIINRFEEYGVKVEQIVNCGGIAERNPLVMQTYADVTGRPMKVSRSAQTCALGAAMAGAVVAGAAAGGHADFAAAQAAMAGLKRKVYRPRREAHQVYARLYALYRQLHDAFGTRDWSGNCHNVMKELLEVRSAARR